MFPLRTVARDAQTVMLLYIVCAVLLGVAIYVSPLRHHQVPPARHYTMCQ